MSEKEKFEFAIYKFGEEIYRAELNEMEQAAFMMGAGLLLKGETNSPYDLVKYIDGKETGRKRISEKVVPVFKRIHQYNWDSTKEASFTVIDKNSAEGADADAKTEGQGEAE